MSKKDFDAFIKKQAKKQVKKPENMIDWNKRKTEWLHDINNFYSIIETWLKEYQKQGQATLKFLPYQLNEEYIGSYETQELHLTIANQEIVFIPIGTILFGSIGRIDMEGKAGKVKFILTDKKLTKTKVQIYQGKKAKNLKWAWKISTPPPAVQLLELNEESFFDALMEVING